MAPREKYDASAFGLTPGGYLLPYEAANRERWLASGGREGLRMLLPGSPKSGGGVFWSRGWKGCPVCARPAAENPILYPFREVRDGVIRQGWSCAHVNVPWDE